MAKRSAVAHAEELLSRASETDDPWLLSYADLVTNLLAFMVLLVSLASISFETIEALPGFFSSRVQQRTSPLATLSADLEKLAEAEGLTGRVRAVVDNEGLAIQLEDRILFPSGIAKLTTEGNRLVDKLARLLKSLPERYRVAVEGHTDDVPISTAQFGSNWELSAARALEVRRSLHLAGVADQRLSIIAYADTRPVNAKSGESTEAFRSRNRRVVIRVF